jgi:S1-C subfamily serine protease
MSLTIPVSTIGVVVDALVEHGRVRRGYLGVGAQTVRLPDRLAGDLDQASGLLLASVEPGAPAEKAGLLQGDILLALDGQQLRRMQDLLAALGGDRVGKTVSVQIVRAGQTQERSAVVGERE